MNIALTIVSSPLKTERIIISAIVPTATPATDTAEITLIAFRDFFAKRYLFAMYNESFTIITFWQLPVTRFLFYDLNGDQKC